MNLGLDIPAITTMPGGDVLRLVRDILNDEAFRVGTLEELLVKNGVAGLLNAERIAVVRALHASSGAITLMLAAAQQTSHNNELTRTRREFVKRRHCFSRSGISYVPRLSRDRDASTPKD